MNFGILGTGMVGQAIADRLSSRGHGVTIGTRNVAETVQTPMFNVKVTR